MRTHGRRRLAVAFATVVGLAATSSAIGAADPNANCLGEDRSTGGGFDTGREFGQAIKGQLEFDRENDAAGSFGRSLAVVARTDCFTR